MSTRTWWCDHSEFLTGLAVAVGAVAPGLLLQASTDPGADAWTVLVAADAAAALCLLRRQDRPTSTLWLVTAVLVAAYVTAALRDSRLAPLALLPLAIALHGAGNHLTGWARQTVALSGTAAVIGGGTLANLVFGDGSHRAGLDVLAVVAAMPLSWTSGVLARRQRLHALHAQRRADDVLRTQRQRETQAAQSERLRIAREMHDVVAHALTLVVLRAETLRARAPELPTWARTEVDEIAADGRRAGDELRDVLRALRSPEDAQVGEAAVTAGAGRGSYDVETLLHSARSVGTHVTAAVDEGFDVLPRHLQLVALRIVRESLTNVRRHAPGSRVSLSLEVVGDAVALTVRNTAPAAPPGHGGGGFGLLSMRERVTAFAGTFRAAPTADGGFEVTARIPLDPRAARPTLARSR